MAKYTIAYKNDKTEEHAERTGQLAHGWVRVYSWAGQQDAYRVFERMVKDGQFEGSILGIFIAHENEVTAWYDRAPRREHDTRVKDKWHIKNSFLVGLINSRSSADL